VDQKNSLYPKILLRTLLNNLMEYKEEKGRLDFECLETLDYFILDKSILHKDYVLVNSLIFHIILSPVRLTITVDRILEVRNIILKIRRYPLPIIESLNQDFRNKMDVDMNKILKETDNPSETKSSGAWYTFMELHKVDVFYGKIMDYLDPISDSFFNQESLIDKAFKNKNNEIENDIEINKNITNENITNENDENSKNLKNKIINLLLTLLLTKNLNQVAVCLKMMNKKDK